jgi:predicted Zn-dependent protease
MTLAGLATFGTLAMLPTPAEKIAALIADQHYPEAIVLLEDRAQHLSLSEYEAFSLATLYRHTGQAARAAAALEQMLKRLPGSMPVLNELAEIYRTENRPQDEIRILLQIFLHSPSEATHDRLLALYELSDDPAGERNQLIAAQRAGIVRTQDSGEPYLLRPATDHSNDL